MGCLWLWHKPARQGGWVAGTAPRIDRKANRDDARPPTNQNTFSNNQTGIKDAKIRDKSEVSDIQCRPDKQICQMISIIFQ